MKKIIILFILTFLLTGCYDYQELNNLAIISGVSIDFIDDEFVVMYEILNSKKGEESSKSSSSSGKTYYIEGSGDTLENAFHDANLKVNKEPYFSHIKVILFSEKVASLKMDLVMDFMLRNPNIRNIFIPVISAGIDAKELLNSPTTENPVCSEAIRNMIETNSSYENIAVNQDFEMFADQLLDLRKDAYMNAITKSEGKIELAGLGAFHDLKLAIILDPEEAATFNVLNNTSYNHYVKLSCEKEKEKYTIIDLYDNGSSKIELEDQKLKLKSYLTASIVEDDCHYDFRKTSSYVELEKKFNEVVEKEYRALIQKLKTYQTDILQIKDSIYKSKRKEIDQWYTYDFIYDIDVNINKNGLVFQVIHDDK